MLASFLISALLWIPTAEARQIGCRHGLVLIRYRDSRSFGCVQRSVRTYGSRFRGSWGRANFPTK